jgi:putative ABC transport system permease protein
LRLVMARGLILTLAGLAAGVGGALALCRLFTSFLFHVSATGPAVFLGVAAAFGVVAMVAAYFPARRGSRVDPIGALR